MSAKKIAAALALSGLAACNSVEYNGHRFPIEQLRAQCDFRKATAYIRKDRLTPDLMQAFQEAVRAGEITIVRETRKGYTVERRLRPWEYENLCNDNRGGGGGGGDHDSGGSIGGGSTGGGSTGGGSTGGGSTGGGSTGGGSTGGGSTGGGSEGCGCGEGNGGSPGEGGSGAGGGRAEAPAAKTGQKPVMYAYAPATGNMPPFLMRLG